MRVVEHLSQPADRAFFAAMRQRGATSPGRACPQRDLPPFPRERLERLIAIGVMREGPPGAYYLFEGATLADEILLEAVPMSGPRMLRTLGFWIVMLALPVVLIWLA